jgi:hypothetical protein
VKILLPQLSVARLALRQGSSQVPFGQPVTLQAGVATLRARVPSVPSGTYALDVVVSDGIDIVNTRARSVRVTGTAASPSPTPQVTSSPSPTPTPSLPAGPSSQGGTTMWTVLVVAVAAGALAIALPVLLRRARR